MHDGAEAVTATATISAEMEPVRDIDRLYAYAAWMLGDRNEALKALKRSMMDPCPPGARLKDRLPALRSVVLSYAHGRPRTSQLERLHSVDALLRKGTSISMPMSHPTLKGDARNMPVLLTGFMQSCLIAGVQTLQAAHREVFVLLVVLGLPEADVLALVDAAQATLSAYKTRMIQGIEAYLEPHCGHIDRNNACRCDRRLLLALERGFVALPKHERPSDAYPYGTFLNWRRLFEVIPPLRLSDETVTALESIS
jgi:hypothetical protein